MIKFYDPADDIALHTIRVTLMYLNYVGHIAYKMGGNVRGADLLTADCFECDTQEDIDHYVENDCKLTHDEDSNIYKAVLTNPDGDTEEVEGDWDEMKNMVVAIEFSNVEEVQNDKDL